MVIIYVAAVTYVWFVTKIILGNFYGVLVQYGRGRFLAGWVSNFCSWWIGRENWLVGEQVNPLASGLTYSPSPTFWPIGWLVGQHLIIGEWVRTDEIKWQTNRTDVSYRSTIEYESSNRVNSGLCPVQPKWYLQDAGSPRLLFLETLYYLVVQQTPFAYHKASAQMSFLWWLQCREKRSAFF